MSGLVKAPKPTRARLWAALRDNKHRNLDIGRLSDWADSDPSAVLHHLRGLVKAGYVVVTKEARATGFNKHLYRLVNDTGVDAPMIGKDGKPLLVGIKNANMWRSMRILKVFSYVDIEAHASTREHPVAAGTVRDYIHMLYVAGYLDMVKKPENKGKHRGLTPAVYTLVKDTGAKAPMVQKLKTVYDQNLNKVMHQEEAGNE